MHAVRLLLATAGLSLAAAASAQPSVSPNAVFSPPLLSTVEVGLTGGYAAGGSGQVSVSRADLAGPLGVRLSLSRSSNDQPQANGQQTRRTLLAYGLDATYDFGQPMPGVATSFYGGLRYGQIISRLSGSGDQTTETTSGAPGLGMGAQIGYLLTNTFSFIAELGLDQYFGNKGEVSQNSQTTPTAERPGTVFRALLGVKYRF
ncbi:hypothetical protein GCM10022631_12580 [Deinococcus rubellus]|uniref:Porin family protein n=1 Tax=Deinococcus rubellus TaxID=1889240 RepID=A0ABY5YCA3_9DEIO|nr:porin family protein [Deinococcus rubellus]UWX62699.1 porin family protein [Deinococcus rubellus]